MSGNSLDNWHQNAIMTDVAVDGPIQLKQFKVECPWCGESYLLVVDRERADRRGYRLCDHCGEFFKFALHAPTEASVTKRVRARPRERRPAV